MWAGHSLEHLRLGPERLTRSRVDEQFRGQVLDRYRPARRIMPCKAELAWAPDPSSASSMNPGNRVGVSFLFTVTLPKCWTQSSSTSMTGSVPSIVAPADSGGMAVFSRIVLVTFIGTRGVTRYFPGGRSSCSGRTIL